MKKSTRLAALILCLCIVLAILSACDSASDMPKKETSAHICSFDQKKPQDNLKKSSATCTEPALYYYSCTCGTIGEECFFVGEPTHVYNQKIASGTHLKSEATENQETAYYYSCICGKNGTEAFTLSMAHTHTFESEWTITEEYHYFASNCGHLGETLSFARHGFDECGKCVCGLTRGTDGLSYTLNSDGESYTLSSIGTATNKSIEIQNIHNGCPVTAIAYKAFYGCTSLVSVSIPDTVEKIGESAFLGCENLENVTIGSGIKSISANIFSGCTRLKTVIIPSGVESIGSSAFYNCQELESVNIPDSVTSIGISAFEGCVNLNYNEYGNVCYLGNASNPHAWLIRAKNTDITSAEILDGTKNIPAYAFEGCEGLASISIPSSVESIGIYAFGGCKGLESITIPEGVKSIGNCAFEGCEGLASITIPEGIKSIGGYTFSGCTSLASVTIPNSVNAIDYSAFDGCEGLDAVYITDIAAWCNIDFVSNHGFYGIPLLNPLLRYAGKLYLDGELLTDVVIPDSITTIPTAVFSGYASLKSITIPESVESIGDYAFAHCIGLTKIDIPSSVASFGLYVFSGCFRLVEIYNMSELSLDVDVNDSGSVSLLGNGNENFVMNIYTPTSGESKLHTTFDGYVFYVDTDTIYLVDYAGSETALTLPSDYNGSTYKIYPFAFAYRTDITSITVSSGVTYISQYAFLNCQSLVSIEFENTANWYRKSSLSLPSVGNGTLTDVSDTSANVEYFTSTYSYFCWVKID